MKSVRPFILDMTYAELRDMISSLGEPAYRADQVLGWVYRKLATSFDDMTDLSIALREKLAATSTVLSLTPVDEKVSSDSLTRKVLFRLWDDRTIESALMLYDDTGTSRERRTVCVSSQVGCQVGCPFCATGQQGFERNLTPGEIIEQVLYFMRFLKQSGQETTMARRLITNVVFMGMGEPLANYGNVWQAVIMLNSKHGIGLGARQITVSTSGLVPQIKQLAEETIQVELAVSLHAADDITRNRLVPVNKKYPLSLLIQACREFFNRTGRRPTFEYALFRGINDSLDDARALSSLLAGMNCHVNLIAGNPACEEYRPSDMKQVQAFLNILISHRISSTIRISRGADIEAGCGQLRSRWLKTGC